MSINSAVLFFIFLSITQVPLRYPCSLTALAPSFLLLLYNYPKAGYTNPEAELHVYSLATQSSNKVAAFAIGETWEYIASVQWAPENISVYFSYLPYATLM